MSSPIDIWNQALSHLAYGKEIGSETEKSDERRACSAFWDSALRQVLRDFDWPFATRYVTAALVATAPTTEWGYSYRKPADCIQLRRIFSGQRNDNESSVARYIIASDSGGDLILTDQASAVFEYTAFIDTVERYPSDFRLALSFYLAFLIAPRLTAGDPFKLGDRAANGYRALISSAQANASNEERRDAEPTSSFERSRL